MNNSDVARMILEGLAYQLAGLPDQIWPDAFAGGCNPAIVNGLRDAREAFNKHVTENDVTTLSEQIDQDVRGGLAELDRTLKNAP
jgi:hypothetical protein